MFVPQNQQQFRNSNADVQIFYGSGGTVGQNHRTWTKPAGVSHIYMMLIGGGANGDGAVQGGGSGAVTVWYGSAQHVPDYLVVSPSRGSGNNTTVSARFSNSTAAPTALLTANASTGTSGAAAMTANQFTASGFFQSVAGVAGNTGGGSQTTFLCGGDSASGTTGNYGYVTALNGIFQLQPIIVSVGAVQDGRGGLGSGGGYLSGIGGPGMVLIASW